MNDGFDDVFIRNFLKLHDGKPYQAIIPFSCSPGIRRIRRIRRADGEAALGKASVASASVLNGSFPQLSRIGLAFDM